MDYKEVFAPVARYCACHTKVKAIVPIGCEVRIPIWKNLYSLKNLLVMLKVEIGKEHKVYKLKKVLNGLKEAPRAWHGPIAVYLRKVLKNTYMSIHCLLNLVMMESCLLCVCM